MHADIDQTAFQSRTRALETAFICVLSEQALINDKNARKILPKMKSF